MIEYMFFENVNGATVTLNEDTYPVHSFETAVDSRRDELDRVLDHGRWPAYQYSGVRTFTIEGAILADEDQLMPRALDLQSAFVTSPWMALRRVGRLHIKYAGIDRELISDVYLDGHPSIPLAGLSPQAAEFQVNLVSDDPSLYSADIISYVTGTPQAGTGIVLENLILENVFLVGEAGSDVDVINPGNMETYATMRLYGPCDAPQIDLLHGTYTARLNLINAYLGDGEYIDIDMRERTIIKNGAENAYQYYNPDGSTWFVIPPGSSTISYTAYSSVSPSRLEIYMQGAYMV